MTSNYLSESFNFRSCLKLFSAPKKQASGFAGIGFGVGFGVGVGFTIGLGLVWVCGWVGVGLGLVWGWL